MKNILPILLCYVLMTSQVFAISGGPVYGGSSINPVGTYSGVITVLSVSDFTHNKDGSGATVINPTTGLAETTPDNSAVSLGLFSLGVPTISVATGAFVQFVNGDVFVGNIVASVQPDSGTISGIVEGTSSFVENFTSYSGNTETIISETVDNSIAGKINAQVGGTRQGSLASASLVGSANLIVNSGGTRVTGSGSQTGSLVQNYALDCVVTGFRQSTSYTSVTSLGLGTVN